jgi:ribonuclease HI
MPAVEIWSDGAFKTAGSLGPRPGWGYIVKVDGEIVRRKSSNRIQESCLKHRNIAGEVVAMIQALRWCLKHGLLDVEAHYDYEGVGLWCDSVGGKGRWKTKNQFTVAYAQEVQKLKSQGLSIQWIHHHGHSGVECNDIADTLATQAADGILVDWTAERFCDVVGS